LGFRGKGINSTTEMGHSKTVLQCNTTRKILKLAFVGDVMVVIQLN
jgi:hypothetical protein